eukprot:789-Eustigmatos_ZCMA.PRE.1
MYTRSTRANSRSASARSCCRTASAMSASEASSGRMASRRILVRSRIGGCPAPGDAGRPTDCR